MSYILDALKKSEQERQKTTGPTLQTIQRSPVITPRRGAAFWGLTALCLMLSTALVATAWRYVVNTNVVSDNRSSHPFLTTGKSTSGSTVASNTETTAAHNTLTAPNTLAVENSSGAESSSAVSEVASNNAKPLQHQGANAAPVKAKVLADEPAPRVVEFWELPDPVQKDIPALTFSFHVYSDNPDRRAIIINKRRVKEGDTVADGLTLQEITTDGVVLNWKRFRFRINVVEQW